MDMTGERRIPASRERVWAALNDPRILQAAIPGCKNLEKQKDNQFRATSSFSVGPVSATFTGTVKLTDLDPPHSYRLEGTGRGGQAGFAKGSAAVVLTEADAETVLTYTAKAEISGKLAQLGARLMDAAAKQLADQFFTRFTVALAVPEGEDINAALATLEAPPPLEASAETAVETSAAPAPVTPDHAMVEPAVPEPAVPESAMPEPAMPDPAMPEPAAATPPAFEPAHVPVPPPARAAAPAAAKPPAQIIEEPPVPTAENNDRIAPALPISLRDREALIRALPRWFWPLLGIFLFIFFMMFSAYL